MTQFFIKTFQKGLKCWNCKKKPIAGYSFCVKHLSQARERFANWSKERKGLGKCIRCDCKGFKGYLRCKKHTLVNRLQCATWMSKHPEYGVKNWGKSKALINAGICICEAHNKIPTGFKRCDDCRVRNRSYDSKHKIKEVKHENRI